MELAKHIASVLYAFRILSVSHAKEVAVVVDEVYYLLTRTFWHSRVYTEFPHSLVQKLHVLVLILIDAHLPALQLIKVGGNLVVDILEPVYNRIFSNAIYDGAVLEVVEVGTHSVDALITKSLHEYRANSVHLSWVEVLLRLHHLCSLGSNSPRLFSSNVIAKHLRYPQNIPNFKFIHLPRSGSGKCFSRVI